ncbi:MAG: hypothetical protein ACLUGI_10950 [Subdoligranulum sp.]
MDYIINSGTDGVWFSDFKAATGADADVRKLIPLGWVDVDECGEFWTCLGRCLKKCRTPQSKYDELTTPLQRFIALCILRAAAIQCRNHRHAIFEPGIRWG